MSENIAEEALKNNDYSADSIQVLEGLEAVRKRPAMYIGDIGVKGLHHLVYEVVDNSIDEALAGHCKNIEVYIHPDNSISVKDDGRGIPVDMHAKEKKSALEVVMTVLHAGGKFDKDSYKVSGGLHGVGVSCVNALSEHLKAEIYRNGKSYVQEYSKGKPLYPVKETGTTELRGTTVTFTPDSSIFITTVYLYDTLAARMRELSFLNKGISINITDLRELDTEGNPVNQDKFYSDRGLVEFVEFLDATRDRLIEDIIYMEGERNGIPVEVAMQYNSSFNENVHSYVNNINTHEGGTHLQGFRRGLTATLKKYAAFKHDKLTIQELENSDLVKVVSDTYKKLGGQLDKLPTNYGPWDISTKDFIIELDEERHFNRYRLETLSSSFYDNHTSFAVANYKDFCNEFESNCLSAASWGKNWKNDSTEKMYLKSNADGNLSGNGSSRWRQRAYYDFMKDITSNIKNIPIIRVSVYDKFRDKTIDSILSGNDNKLINDFIDEIRK